MDDEAHSEVASDGLRFVQRMSVRASGKPRTAHMRSRWRTFPYLEHVCGGDSDDGGDDNDDDDSDIDSDDDSNDNDERVNVHFHDSSHGKVENVNLTSLQHRDTTLAAMMH